MSDQPSGPPPERTGGGGTPNFGGITLDDESSGIQGKTVHMGASRPGGHWYWTSEIVVEEPKLDFQVVNGAGAPNFVFEQMPSGAFSSTPSSHPIEQGQTVDGAGCAILESPQGPFLKALVVVPPRQYTDQKLIQATFHSYGGMTLAANSMWNVENAALGERHEAVALRAIYVTTSPEKVGQPVSVTFHCDGEATPVTWDFVLDANGTLCVTHSPDPVTEAVNRYNVMQLDIEINGLPKSVVADPSHGITSVNCSFEEFGSPSSFTQQPFRE